MPIARLTGSVKGRKDPSRKARAKLMYRLFDAGWDIYNGNGDQTVTLNNIQEKIVESDAFVFMPGATLEDMFNAASIFVGFQTNDKDLKCKHAIILNSDNSWDPFIELIERLYDLGTVHDHHDTYLTVLHKTREVINLLEEKYDEMSACQAELNEPDIITEKVEYKTIKHPTPPEFNVCVFCSASIKKEHYLDKGYTLGKNLAEEGWGCVSGAGCTGIMGKVVEGAVAHGGWTGGSNVPHIIAMEGLPEGLSEFWPRGDIYTRMEIMIEKSDMFVAMPGGLGTVQEVLALIILKEQRHDLMRDKEIIIVNQKTSSGKGFWSSLLDLLDSYGVFHMYHVVDEPEEVIAKIKELRR